MIPDDGNGLVDKTPGDAMILRHQVWTPSLFCEIIAVDVTRRGDLGLPTVHQGVIFFFKIKAVNNPPTLLFHSGDR